MHKFEDLRCFICRGSLANAYWPFYLGSGNYACTACEDHAPDHIWVAACRTSRPDKDYDEQDESQAS